jgi:hypothetical protein
VAGLAATIIPLRRDNMGFDYYLYDYEVVEYTGTVQALYHRLFNDTPQFVDSRPYEIEPGATFLCNYATGPHGQVVSVGNLEFHVYRR